MDVQIDQHSWLDRSIEFLLYLVISVVPLVYFNNPIATEYFFSKAFFLNFLTYLTITLFFVRALVRNELTLRWGLTFPPLILFCVVALQSLVGVENYSKGWETIFRVGAVIPFVLVLYQQVGTRAGLHRFLAVVAVTNLIITTFGFLQYYEVFPLPKDQYGTPDPSTTIGLTNFVMEYLSPYMFIIPLMAIIAKGRLPKALFITAAAFQFYYFLISDNRAAQVGFAASLPLGAILIYNQYRRGTYRFSRRTIGIAAGIFSLALVAIGTSEVGDRFIARAQSIFAAKDDAITFRFETWKQSLLIFADHPIRGVGLSNLEIEFPLYQSEFLEYMTLKKNTRVVRAHNEYIQVFVDLGLLGAVVFFWLLISIVRLGIRAYRKAVHWDDLLLITGLLLGVTTYLVVSFFAFPLEVPSSCLSILFIISLIEIMTSRVLAVDESSVLTLSKQFTLPVAGTFTVLSAAAWVFASVFMWNVLHAEVNFKESRVMKDLNQHEYAKGLLDEAIKLYPKNEAYYYDRSIFAIRENDVPAALADLQMTARLVPNYGMGHKQIGLLAAQMGDYKRAADEFQFAYRIYKHLHNDYVPLVVNAYIGAGEPERAVQIVEELAAQKIVIPEVLLSTGQAYLAVKDYPKSVANFQKLLAGNPQHPEGNALLGSAYVESGEFGTALEFLDKAQKLNISGASQKMALQLNRARALVGLKRMDEAKQAIEAMLATDPSGAKRMLMSDPVLPKIPELQPLLRP